MYIKILVVGKTKKTWLLQGEKEYLEKIKKHARVEFEIIEASVGKNRERNMKEESGKIEKRLRPEFLNILLDVAGKEMDSLKFSEVLKNGEIKGKICFVIGGSDGVLEQIKNRFDLKISLSKMTFIHEMIRVFLLEQIFRGFEIKNGGDYHK